MLLPSYALIIVGTRCSWGDPDWKSECTKYSSFGRSEKEARFKAYSTRKERY